MPWSNQNGGRRGGGSGGPWGGPPRGGNGQQPPDLDELLRKSQDKLKSMLPGGGGGASGGGIGRYGAALIVGLAVVVWGVSGFYRVESDELGVNLVLGKVVSQSTPGLNYNLPYPLGTVYRPKVLTLRETEIGTSDIRTGRGVPRDSQESQMLTGDENLVDVDFKVQWTVKDAPAFLFNIANPDDTVKAVAESAMREVVGRSNIQPILTEDRRRVESSVRDLMQKTLDGYSAGVDVRLVQMQKVDPPREVIDAFRNVQAARIDAERMQNEAQTEANRVVPEARGQASQITQAAQAFQRRTVEEARGQADRFSSVYEEYRKAPDVTRERLYLETMERVLSGMDKTVVEGVQAVQPYLPLDRLQRTTPRPGGQN